MASPALRELVTSEAPYLTITDADKVVCRINGHTMPPNMEVIEAFVRGRKYRRLKAQELAALDVAKYEPILTPSVNFPDKLFCSLTNLLIARSSEAIKMHMHGQRFARAKARFEAGKQEMFEEPCFEDDVGTSEPMIGEADSNGGVSDGSRPGSVQVSEEEAMSGAEETREESARRVCQGDGAQRRRMKRKAMDMGDA